MEQAGKEDFQVWLNTQLRELNTDESVFGSYIIGILEGEETEEEKAEALEGILSEIIHDKLEDFIAAVLNKWLQSHPQQDEPHKKGLSIDVNEQLAKMLEAQTMQQTKQERHLTEEEKRIKEQILAQYSQTEVSDEEDDVAPTEAEKQPSNSITGIEKNTNAQDVLQLQKERREQARQDSAAKKQKDKEDREKQRQLRDEKKEKRKTVKGERRR